MKTKYDWSNVPPEVNWIATDAVYTGGWGYTEEPVIMPFYGTWYAKGINNKMVGIVAQGYSGDWKDSLEERPK